MADSGQNADQRYLTFRSENRLYALPAWQVSEVIRTTSLARVPQAPKCLLGLANLRGAVMPVASVRGLLGLQETATTPTSRLIVLDGVNPVALEVDEVAALVTVPASQLNAADAALSAAAGEQLQGVFQTDGHVTKILDIRALLDRAFPLDQSRRRTSSAVVARIDQDRVVEVDHRRLVTFEVAAQEYALDLDNVREIVMAPGSLTHIPGSDDAVLGVMSYRERLLPLLSLRILLGFPAASHTRDKVIVTTVGETLVGLVADGTRSIIPVEPDRIEQAPPVLRARAGGEAQIAEIYRASASRLISILVPERLFREEVMQKLSETEHAINAKAASTLAEQGRDLRFLAFKLDGNEFALPIDAVDEVARVPEQITRLPKTPKFLEGVVNLRGVVLPVVDQRRRFDMPVMEKDAGRRLVVVRTEQHRAGLIVDSVTEVLRCSSQAIKPAPDLTGEALGLVPSVINLEQAGRILLLLDPSELLSRAERSLLDAFSKDTSGNETPDKENSAAASVIKVLVVDDSALVRKLIGKVFATQPDFQVSFARNGKEALDSIASAVPDVVTLDVHMPEMDGLACLDRIMIEHPCPVIMFSSMTVEGANATLEALRLGAVDFVAKPTGAVSLRIDEIAPALIEKVRQAAAAKLKRSLRLRERVRHRIGGVARNASERRPRVTKSAATGDGLVLIGVSTGGPPALETLLTGLPVSFPWPMLIAQHMPATFTGPLARRLDGLSELTVIEVREPTALQPGFVYVGRGDADIIVSRRGAGLVAMATPAATDYPWHPSADRLVRSAMNHMAPSQLIGILMTGMGNDGAEAMTLLHSKGGRTIAEAEETAVVWGMPGELVKAGGADFVVPVQDIAAQLQKLVP